MNKVLCIPRIESITQIDSIQKVIDQLNIGLIKKIIEIPHRNNSEYKRILIYIQLNKESNNTKIIETRFANKQDVKIIYQFPWYWKIVEAQYQTQTQTQTQNTVNKK